MDKLSVKRRIVEISNKIRIGKDGHNEYGNYDYFKPDSILTAINPLLQEYGLITLFNLVQNNGYYTATLSVEDMDTDEKISYQFDIDKAAVKGANPAQASGATLTYAKRYLLMNAFNIADNAADFDATANTPQNTAPITQEPATIPQKSRNHKKLFAVAKKAGISKDEIDEWIQKRYNKTSIRFLTNVEYDVLMKKLELSIETNSQKQNIA